MENGIKTIEAADNGITSIKQTIESMKSTLLQARQDKSFKSTTYSVGLTAAGRHRRPDLVGRRGDRHGQRRSGQHAGGPHRRPPTTRTWTSAAPPTPSTASLNFHHCRQRRYRARRRRDSDEPTPTSTVAVDGGAATNFAVADADAVTGADMVGALNAGFAAAATPVAVTVSGATGAAARLHVRHRRSQTAPPTSSSPPARSTAPAVAASFGFTPTARSPRLAPSRRPSTRSSPASTPTPCSPTR